MTAAGFSFPCTCPARSLNETFERFIEAAKTNPNKVQSPYPSLAGLYTYRQARTQPLTKIMYFPTSEEYDTFGESYLDELLIYYHEIYHTLSATAPAKLIARLLLGRAYDSLSVLLHRVTWDNKMEKSWDEIKKINTQLTDICSSILLSEELLATAISVAACSKHSESYSLKALRNKEEEIVTHCSKLPHFRESYYHTLMKVMQWNNECEYPLVQYLQFYLQGIKGSQSPRALRLYDDDVGGFIVAKSVIRCRILAEHVNAMRSGKELFDWLNQTLCKNDELKWFFAAMVLLSEEKNDSVARYSLWKLMVGESELEEIDNLDVPD
jgi:hypothetical protein